MEARDLPTLMHAYRAPWASDGSFPRSSKEESPQRFRFESEWLIKGMDRGVKQGQWPQIPSFHVSNLDTVNRITFPFDSVAFAETYKKAEFDADFARGCQARYAAVMQKAEGKDQRVPWWGRAGGAARPRMPLTPAGRPSGTAPERPGARRSVSSAATPVNAPGFGAADVDDAPFATDFNNDRYVVRRPSRHRGGIPAPPESAGVDARRHAAAQARSAAEKPRLDDTMSWREMCQRVLRTRRLRLTGSRAS